MLWFYKNQRWICHDFCRKAEGLIHSAKRKESSIVMPKLSPWWVLTTKEVKWKKKKDAWKPSIVKQKVPGMIINDQWDIDSVNPRTDSQLYETCNRLQPGARDRGGTTPMRECVRGLTHSQCERWNLVRAHSLKWITQAVAFPGVREPRLGPFTHAVVRQDGHL